MNLLLRAARSVPVVRKRVEDEMRRCLVLGFLPIGLREAAAVPVGGGGDPINDERQARLFRSPTMWIVTLIRLDQ